MPHVIISGMPGIGKTTSVLCLARQLLGDSYKEAVLELNASDERGKRVRAGPGTLCSVLHRYRCCAKQNQGLRTEEGHPARWTTQDCHSRRSRQHDLWRTTGTSKDYGDLLEYHPLCVRLQPVEQDH